MTDIQMFLVGGAVRDGLIGKQTKDYDYTVVVDSKFGFSADDAYAFMLDELKARGFKVFLDTPQYFTLRAQFPKGDHRARTTADFVLARQEGPYTDGRRPDWVKPGTLEDDLRRRDFTVNALAETGDGDIIDMFGGIADLADKRLRAVGDPRERLREDALRAFRAIRFAITKGFYIDNDLKHAMKTVSVLDSLVDNISADRIKDEMHKCFAYDSVKTMTFMVLNYPEYLAIMQDKGIWVEPTLKGRKIS